MLKLVEEPLEELTNVTDEIREKFCAQSTHYQTACHENYPLLSTEELLKQAMYNDVKRGLGYKIEL